MNEETVYNFRVLSFNLNLLPMGVNPVGHGYKSDRLAEFLRHMDEFDVLALQEVFASPWLGGYLDRQEELVREAEERGYHVVRGAPPSLGDLWRSRSVTDGGLLILSRLPITRSGRMTFVQRGLHLDAGASKGCLFAEIKVGRGRFCVFNTHLQATHAHRRGGGRYDSVRREQLLELRAFIQKESRGVGGARPLPWLLTGDFNVDAIATPASADEYGYVYDNQMLESEEYMHLVRQLSPNGRMRDLLKEAHGGEHPPTRPPRLEFPSSVDLILRHKYPQRLDYVFWAGAEGSRLRPVVNRTRVEEFAVRAKPYSHISDHFGISVPFVYEPDDPGEILDLSAEMRFGDVFASPKGRTGVWSPRLLRILRWTLLVGGSAGTLWLFLGRDALLGFVAVVVLVVGLSSLGWALRRLRAYRLAHLLLRNQSRFRSEASPSEPRHWVCGHYSDSLGTGPLHLSPLASSKFGSSSTKDTPFPSTARDESTSAFRPNEDTAKKTARRGTDGVHREIEDEHREGACGESLRNMAIDETVYEGFHRMAEQFGYRPCLGTRRLQADGTRGGYAWLTYGEVQQRVANVASGLHHLGLRAGDVVAVIAAGCPESVIVDLACARMGYVVAHLLDIPRGLDESAARLVVCSRAKAPLVLEKAPASLQRVVQIEPLEYAESYMADRTHLRLTPLHFVEQDGLRQPVEAAVALGADAPFVLALNGAQNVGYSHRNVLASARAFCSQGRQALSVGPSDVHFSYFPVTHLLERSVQTLMLVRGGSIGFCQGDRPKFFDDIRELRPTLLLGVPGVFVRLYRKWKMVVGSWWGPRRALIHWVFRESRLRSAHGPLRSALTRFLAALLFARLRRSLGGRLRLITVVSDGLLPNLHQQFLRIGFSCAVTEAYLRPGHGLMTLSSMRLGEEDEWAGFPTLGTAIRLVDVPQLGLTSRGPESMPPGSTLEDLRRFESSPLLEDREEIRKPSELPPLSSTPSSTISPTTPSHSVAGIRWKKKKSVSVLRTHSHYSQGPTSSTALPLAVGMGGRKEQGLIQVQGDGVARFDWDTKRKKLRIRRQHPPLQFTPSPTDSVSTTETSSGAHESPHFTDSAWRSTEDIGQWNANGSLTVLGPRTGILEPMKGQFVFNKYLEYVYIESPFIQQIYITCKRYRPLVAIVVPDPEAVFLWARAHSSATMTAEHADPTSLASLCTLPAVRDRILRDFALIAEEHALRPFEAVAGIHLTPNKFSLRNGTVLPDFNLHRDKLKRLYRLQLGELYRSLGRASSSNAAATGRGQDSEFYYLRRTPPPPDNEDNDNDDRTPLLPRIRTLSSLMRAGADESALDDDPHAFSPQASDAWSGNMLARSEERSRETEVHHAPHEKLAKRARSAANLLEWETVPLQPAPARLVSSESRTPTTRRYPSLPNLGPSPPLEDKAGRLESSSSSSASSTGEDGDERELQESSFTHPSFANLSCDFVLTIRPEDDDPLEK